MKEKILVLTASLLLGALFAPLAAQQVEKLPRLGFIHPAGTPEHSLSSFDAFRSGLQGLGYVEGKNVSIEVRYAAGRLDRMPALVTELVQHKVDIIVAVNNVVIRAAKEATNTIPIVMVTSVDPVAAGYVESFAHPGGNITGLANLGRDLSAKRVELLRELIPKVSRIAIIWDADGPGPIVAFKEYEAAARAFKIEVRSLEIRGPRPDFERAFQVAKSARADALVVVRNPLMTQHAKEVFELATRNRLPSMTEEGRFVNAGGLISYAANAADLFGRAAEYVVKILKGAKPGDLPVKLPEKFELFVNLKTAQQIGVTIPQHVLVQADKVIK